MPGTQSACLTDWLANLKETSFLLVINYRYVKKKESQREMEMIRTKN